MQGRRCRGLEGLGWSVLHSILLFSSKNAEKGPCDEFLPRQGQQRFHEDMSAFRQWCPASCNSVFVLSVEMLDVRCRFAYTGNHLTCQYREQLYRSLVWAFEGWDGMH